jgi:hypothetical protein
MNDIRDYKKDYEDFWKEIIEDENGNINMDQLQRELSDYSICLENVPKVYCAVTGGMLSKPNYEAHSVISVFDEQFGNPAAYVKLLGEDWDIITEDCETNAEYKKEIFEYLEIDKDE